MSEKETSEKREHIEKVAEEGGRRHQALDITGFVHGQDSEEYNEAADELAKWIVAQVRANYGTRKGK